MKTLKAVLALAAVPLAGSVAGESFDWVKDGNVRSYTLQSDVTFTTFDGISDSGGSEASPNIYVLRLDGHTFTWNNKPWCTSGYVPTNRDAYPNPTLRVIGPGKASGTMNFGGNGNGSSNGLWLENGVVWNGDADKIYGATRIVVKDGSVFNWKGWGLQSHAASKNGYIRVEGEGSTLKWTSGWTEHCIHHDNSGVYLKDGATLVGYIVRLGDLTHQYFGVAGDHSTIEVDDSTFRVASEFYLGGMHDPSMNPKTDTTDVKYPTLRLLGPRAWVAPTAKGSLDFHVYDQIGARIEYVIPKDGFVDAVGAARVPFEASKLVVHPDRCAGRPFIADTVVSVRALDWMVKHPGEKMSIFKVRTVPTGNEMAWLASKVTFEDFEPSLFDVPPQVAVSEDGTQIEITAASGVHVDAFDPQVALTAAQQGTDGQCFTMKVEKFGALASALTTLTLDVSKNADFSEATSVILDPTTLTKEGDILTYSMTGLDKRAVYYARVNFANDRGQNGSRAISLATGGDAAALFLFASASGGSWEEPGNWVVAKQPATSWPTMGDSIGFSAHGDYTISSTGNKDVSKIILSTSDCGATAPTVYTFNLGGGNLNLSDSPRISGSLVSNKIDYKPFNPSLEIKNGTLTASSGKSLAFGTTGTSGGGGMIIGQGGKWTSGRGDFNGSSRLIVRDGGVMTADTWGFFWRSSLSGCGFVMVTGEGSSYTTGGRFYANGDNSGLIAHDGGEVTLNGGLSIGNFNQPYYGHGADRAFVEISNATVRVKSELKLGDIHEWHPDTQANDTSDVKYPTLRFKGRNPVLKAPDGQSLELKVYDGLGGRIEFVVPEAGYETIPLQVDTISWVERPEGASYADFGKTEFIIDGQAWMKANCQRSLTLVKIATPNKAGLERLIAKASIVGKRTLPADCLKVSDDGTAIVLTAVNQGLLLFVL